MTLPDAIPRALLATFGPRSIIGRLAAPRIKRPRAQDVRAIMQAKPIRGPNPSVILPAFIVLRRDRKPRWLFRWLGLRIIAGPTRCVIRRRDNHP